MKPRRAIWSGIVVALFAQAATAEPFAVQFRSNEPDALFQPLRRTSILNGEIEFAARVDAADLTLRDFRVLSEAALLDGRQGQLCRSDAGSCVVDFGPRLRGHALTFVARLADETHTVRISTLRIGADRGIQAASETKLIEHAASRSHPPDYVTRAVRVTDPVDDSSVRGLRLEQFAATARGIGGVRVLDVEPPAPDAPCVVPVLWNVSAFLSHGRAGLAWTRDHGAMVRRLVAGMRDAARRGFDCELLVAEYAAVSRPLFGPVRLNPGEDLDAVARTHNESTLAGLTKHLLRDPDPRWAVRPARQNVPGWKTDFYSAYHTFNDLLRGYPGRKNLLLVTDGSDRHSVSEVEFQHDLWPQRVEELNEPWSPERLDAFLSDLDREVNGYDPLVAEYAAGLEAKDPEAQAKLATFVAQVDPGGLSSLHPHRKDVWFPVDTLVFSTPRTPQEQRGRDGSLPGLGGELWAMRVLYDALERDPRLAPASRDSDDALDIADALLAVQRHTRDAYRVELLVPNRDQDRKPHSLRIALSGLPGEDTERLELSYLAAYYSSPPLAQKIALYASSEFKVLRLLAAHRFREHAFDDRYYDLLRGRWSDERDEQVRQLLFESWVSIQLQRLQVTEAQVKSKRHRRRYATAAWDNLSNIAPQKFPDPRLAAEARRVASSYRASAADWPD